LGRLGRAPPFFESLAAIFGICPPIFCVWSGLSDGTGHEICVCFDDLQIGQGRLVRLGSMLHPVAQCANWDMESFRELLLRRPSFQRKRFTSGTRRIFDGVSESSSKGCGGRMINPLSLIEGARTTPRDRSEVLPRERLPMH
jgi:hypothetical protein